jgi:curved DNA-binding protein CbpA
MVSETADHYRVLQVHPAADLEVIQAAYRVLARRYHPDHSGSDETMKRLNAAWEILRDPGSRGEYDRSLGMAPGTVASTSGTTSSSSSVIHASPMAPQRQPAADHAGPPVGQPSGTKLTYGRYDGWTLGQIAMVDPDFLEWLRSVPGGRYLRPEIDAILKEVRGPGRVGGDGWSRDRRFSPGVVIG